MVVGVSQRVHDGDVLSATEERIGRVARHEAGPVDHILVLLELHAVRHVDPADAGQPLVVHRNAFGSWQQRTA